MTKKMCELSAVAEKSSLWTESVLLPGLLLCVFLFGVESEFLESYLAAVDGFERRENSTHKGVRPFFTPLLVNGVL